MIVTRGIGASRTGSIVAGGLTLFGVDPGPFSIAGRLCLSLAAPGVTLITSRC
jgi:hypothetical protein